MSFRWKKPYANTRFKEPVQCPYNCGAILKTSLQLARHILTYHNFSNSDKKFQCPLALACEKEE